MTAADASRVLDFRSDTVTQPDAVMRQAMATAEVGDNMLDTDPTVAVLEQRSAQVLGMAEALWVPSGTMANAIALSVHLQRGDRFLVPQQTHVLLHEMASAGWLAGSMPHALEHDGGPGWPSPSTLEAAIGPRDPSYYELRTTLLWLENPHNGAGGTIIPPHEHAQLVSVARQAGLRVHLDGARIWNAAVAQDLPPAALTVGVDSVSACFSKGLAAPVGSVIAGDAEFIEQARRMRHALGGSVRQAGILAAACLIGLDRMSDLAVDHTNARLLAQGLSALGWEVNQPQTNIVLARVADIAVTTAQLQAVGILVLSLAGQIRFALHRDLSQQDIEEALHRIKTEVHQPTN